MQQRWRLSPRTAFVMGTALLILSSPAAADRDLNVADEPMQKLSGKSLLGEPKPESVTQWFRTNIRTKKKRGFEYSRSVSMKNRDKRLIFSIQGPLIKKKTPGLAFEVRF